LWTKKPLFKDNNHGTATQIRADVNTDLRLLQEKPDLKTFLKGWKPADDNDKLAITKEIGRITKRVARIARNDN
jgi:hypothetical protein